MDFFILRKQQTNGEKMVKVRSGKKIGQSTMVGVAKQKNGRTSGAVLIQTHPLNLGMLMFGMKGVPFIT